VDSRLKKAAGRRPHGKARRACWPQPPLGYTWTDANWPPHLS